MLRKGKKPQKLTWMMLDREGLPIIVADSAKELAEKAGVRENNIRSAVSHQNSRGYEPTGSRRPQKWVAFSEDE